MVAVIDEGPGIPASEKEKIFCGYYRSKNKPTISRFGIGLFLRREIITRHNGYIWVESENGKGAKILITLSEYTA